MERVSKTLLALDVGRHGAFRRWVTLIVVLGVLVAFAAGLLYELRARAPSRYARPPSVSILSDAQVRRQISFAYMAKDDLWVSLHGATARMVAYLPLLANAPYFQIVWSQDETRLLVIGRDTNSYVGPGSVDSEFPPHTDLWVVTLPSGAVTDVSGPLASCLDNTCLWLGARYIVYRQSQDTPITYGVYDTQAQSVVATTLDGKPVDAIETRGSAVYFSSSSSSAQNPCPQGVIRRFDMGSNTVSPAFSIPGPYLVHHAIIVQWDVSADGSRAMVASQSTFPDSACKKPPRAHIYLLQSGWSEPLYSADLAVGEFALTADGQFAAWNLGPFGAQYLSSGFSPAIGVFNTYTGAARTHTTSIGIPAITGLQGRYQLLNWVGQDAGVLAVATQEDNCPYVAVAGVPPLPCEGSILLATSLYYTPAGGSSPGRLIETVKGPDQLYFPFPVSPAQPEVF